MPIYIADVESTGVSKSDQVIQYASIHIPEDRESLLTHKITTPLFQQYAENNFQSSKAILDISLQHFNPSVPINPHAQEVHGISKLFLIKHKPVSLFKVPEMSLLIGHNSIFDVRMLSQTDSSFSPTSIKVICTMRLAKAIEKIAKQTFGFKSYSLFDIFDFFYPDYSKLYATKLHNALGDCEMTLLVLIKLWENFPFITNLYDLQEYFFELDGCLKKVKKK